MKEPENNIPVPKKLKKKLEMPIHSFDFIRNVKLVSPWQQKQHSPGVQTRDVGEDHSCQEVCDEQVPDGKNYLSSG